MQKLLYSYIIPTFGVCFVWAVNDNVSIFNFIKFEIRFMISNDSYTIWRFLLPSCNSHCINIIRFPAWLMIGMPNFFGTLKYLISYFNTQRGPITSWYWTAILSGGVFWGSVICGWKYPSLATKKFSSKRLLSTLVNLT